MGEKLEIHTFGGLTILLNGGPIKVRGFERKPRALLVYLACAGRDVPRDLLAAMFFGDLPDKAAHDNLRPIFTGLRDAVGPFVNIPRESAGMNPDSDWWLDAADFEARLKTAGKHNIWQLEIAVKLYKGDFLEGFSLGISEFEDWARAQQEHYRLQAIDALDALATAYLNQGEYARGITHALRLQQMDAWREDTYCLLMKLYALSGQTGNALAQYETCRRELRKIGVDLAPETTALYEQIKAGPLTPKKRPEGEAFPAEPGDYVGSGAFGAVYRASQPASDYEVAYKLIRPEYANHPDFIRRFEAEAQRIKQLAHPAVVPLESYWRGPGKAYLVMRWYPGNLADRIKHGPLALADSLRVLDRIAAGLDAAHRYGVIHHALKPSNILLDGQGNAYLSDFGIVRALIPARDLARDGGAVLASPYLAPEQVAGETVTPRADLYGLGIVLYEMLAGQPPPNGAKSLREMRPDLPPALDDVIQQATAFDPAQRYPDARSLAEAFRAAACLPVEMPPGAAADVPCAAESAAPVALSVPARNPYKGLYAFSEADAVDFFGRAAVVDELLARLDERGPLARFLAVVGPSGSGKSSVVNAGLIPALRAGRLDGSENWFIARVFPGAHPFEDVERALTRIAATPDLHLMPILREDERGLLRAARRVLPEDGTLLLVVDQFEEVFTLVNQPAEAAHFMASLAAAVTDPRSPVRVIITLRADFYDRPLMHPEFSELVSARTHVVRPLTAHELEQAISVPAEQVGLRVEPGLVAAVVADVNEQPGALPMLQYALTELADCRDDSWLTLSGYRAIGGVRGALARRAQELYQALDADHQGAAQQLFLRLVTLGEGTEDTRRRVSWTEIVSLSGQPGLMRDVVERFAEHRLLTLDRDPLTREPAVEVAHEALLHEWGQLRAWLDDCRADIRQQRLLASAAAEWLAFDQDESVLLRGARLADFEDWAMQTSLALTQAERDFLDTSVTAYHRQIEAERARQARERQLERRSRNRLRYLVGVFALAAVLAVILSLFALGQQRRAEDARATSDANALIAERSAAESRSLLQSASVKLVSATDSALALALAIAANDMDNPPLPSQYALAEYAYAPGARQIWTDLPIGDVQNGFWDINAEGTLAVASDYYDAWLVETTTGNVRPLPEGYFALFGPDEQEIVLYRSAAFHTQEWWNPVTGQTRFQLCSFDINVFDLSQFVGEATSRTLRAAKTFASGTELLVWDVSTCTEKFELHHDSDVRAVAFSPDNAWILTSDSGDTDATDTLPRPDNEMPSLILWRAADGMEIRRYRLPGQVYSLVFSPDSQQALVGLSTGDILLWDVNSGEEIWRGGGHINVVTAVTWSPDGRYALSGDRNGLILVWDMASKQVVYQFYGYTGDINRIVVTPDGRRAVSLSSDGAIIWWDLTPGIIVTQLRNHTDRVTGGIFNHAGDRALTFANDKQLILWDMAPGSPTFGQPVGNPWIADKGVTTAAFSPDDTRVLSASLTDNSLTLWDAATGRKIRHLQGHTDWITSVVFSPDGKTALSASLDTTVIVWNVDEASPDFGTPIRRLEGHTERVNSVVFSPDGQTALSAARDKTIIWWEVDTGQILRTLSDHTDWVTSVVFTPDGQRALSGSDDDTLILWDLASGRIIHQFARHTSGVQAVAVSPDGRSALSAGRDKLLILWDLATGVELRRFEGHADALTSVAFSRDGQTALTGSMDKTLIVWRIDTVEELIAWTCANRVVRVLTDDEQDQYRAEADPCAGK